jgi:hypothetical protein
MPEKLRSDKNEDFGRNMSWRNSNRFIGIIKGTEVNNKNLKPGCAGVPVSRGRNESGGTYECRS